MVAWSSRVLMTTILPYGEPGAATPVGWPLPGAALAVPTVCADRSPRGAPGSSSSAASPSLSSVGATVREAHRVTTATPENGFAALGALPETVEALEKLGITTPFAIQTMTLPIALAGHDLLRYVDPVTTTTPHPPKTPSPA